MYRALSRSFLGSYRALYWGLYVGLVDSLHMISVKFYQKVLERLYRAGCTVPETDG